MAGNNFSGSNISFGFGEEDIIMAEEQPWWNGSAYGDSNAVEGLGHRDSINNNNNCCSCAHEPHLKRRKNPDHEAHGDEVSRTPLFFRETNPQPRKHTLWQSTSDFTGGQASICRRHLLQFPEGVLNRHFDKLIQCDPRLKELSERSMPFSGSPFFEGQIPMLDMHPHLQFAYPRNVISTMRLGGLQNDGLMHYNHIPAPVVKQNNVHINEQLRERASAEAQPFSPSSVMDSRTKDESSTSDTEDQSAKDLRRHAGYKKTGTAMLFNQRSMHNRLASLKRGHKPSNVGSATMLSHPAIHDCEVFRCGEQNEKDALLNKHILERLYLHLLGDPLPENFLTNEQIAQCAQDLKQRVQQRKLLPSGLSEHTKMLSGPSTSDNSLTNNSGGHQL